jgi:hypothetical protein
LRQSVFVWVDLMDRENVAGGEFGDACSGGGSGGDGRRDRGIAL